MALNPHQFRLWQPKHITLGDLLKRAEEGRLKVPQTEAPSNEWAMALIESLILHAPIGSFLTICSSRGDAGTDHLVDGARRLNTIQSFINDEWAFGKSAYFPQYNGLTCSEIGASVSRRILGQTVDLIGMEPTMSRDMMVDFALRMGVESTKIQARMPVPEWV